MVSATYRCRDRLSGVTPFDMPGLFHPVQDVRRSDLQSRETPVLMVVGEAAVADERWRIGLLTIAWLSICRCLRACVHQRLPPNACDTDTDWS